MENKENKFERLSNFINSGDIGLVKGKKILDVQLNKIAPRFSNLYIRNDERLKPLIATIKNEGFSVPINVMPINKAIEIAIGNQEEHDYLLKQKEIGKDYVIISGHRRFYSCCHIALEIFRADEYDPSKEIRDQIKLLDDNLYKEVNDEIDELNIFGSNDQLQERISKAERLYIQCVIEEGNINKENETLRHMKENLARENTSSFEIVVNVYNYINDYGLVEEICDKYGQDGTTSFPIIMSRYLSDEYGFDINPKTVSGQIDLLKFYHPEIVQMIFKNEFALRDAKTLISTYKKLNEAEKMQADELIKAGEYDKVKSLKIKQKAVKINKSFKQKEIVEILNKIKKGSMSLEEAINYFEGKR